VDPRGEPRFEVLIGEEPPTRLFAERLRDGRIALGTTVQQKDGSWTPGELHLLEPAAYLDLAAWLSPAVEGAWLETVRDRQTEPLRTARELYGPGRDAVERLIEQMLREVPPALLARGMILLANSIGPESRRRLIDRLNRTSSVSEDAELRRRLADENEAFAYVVAAAALYDALEEGVADEE